MLKFDDFFHLPELDEAIAQVADGSGGLVLIAGLDPRVLAGVAEGQLLPSGRAMVFRALVGLLLARAPNALAVAESRAAARVPRRVQVLPVRPPHSYADTIAKAAERRPDLLILDRLDAAGAPAAFDAAGRGVRVIAQLDTVCRGAEVARHLRDLGVAPEQLGQLGWVVAVERVATLCPICARPGRASAGQAARLSALLRRHGLPEPGDGQQYYTARGCDQCGYSGRQGDVAVFDVYDARGAGVRLLPREAYVWRLVERSQLALDDLLDHDAERLYRTYTMLSRSAQALGEANASLQSKLIEIEAANEVLRQRTAALRSLHTIGQALTRSTDLAELALQVCRQAGELCGVDRVLLYLARPNRPAAVLAAHGWDERVLNQPVDLAPLELSADSLPRPFAGWPPGTAYQHPDVAGFELRAGISVPLIAEAQPVGLMIIQSTQKARLAPADVALVEAFAAQAALAIQRAELIDARLRQERLERELDLAREVQQSVLPRVFPRARGYSFAACNQPARSVGGDLYDVFWVGDDQIGVVIADVSGKSMPAALYMALTRSLLLAEARRERSPRAVLLSVNQLLREMGDPQMFVTVFYGVIACSTGRLTYARAGHDYPLLLRDGEATPLGGRGIVLGAFDSETIVLSEEQLDLRAGDRLVLYTDGLTDVFAPDGERFGADRLGDLFQAHAGRDPMAFCDAVFADLAVYQGAAEQFDDMTLLVVSVGAA
ncbi:SpoIIE family protein phosphatase [Kouleothrix sp.]|uniref:PP2C family protein-serine/threonine phosphatase n=1 Tax=Kouleothrix sp. TaxID=2779161 RepID=UPI00391DCFE4